MDFKRPLFGMVVAPLAFLAWAVALPEGPLRSARWYTEEAGGVILTIATVAIASCAYIFGQESASRRRRRAEAAPVGYRGAQCGSC